MKKGFTLIELLAVIVILAIIALIAIPTITNIVEEARKGAAKNSILGYIDAVEKQAAINLLNSDETDDIKAKTYDVSELTEKKVVVKGKVPTGTVTVNEKGEVTDYELFINNYIVTPTNGDPNKPSAEKNNTSQKAFGGTKVEAISNETHKGIVYLNPTDLTEECTEANSVSTTGTKTGCMKFYIYDDSGDTYKMILDHNTTAKVAWNSNRSNDSMGEVATALSTDTTGWQGSPGLITANEIASITENTTFNGTYFYFGSNNTTSYSSQTEEQKVIQQSYAWLFDYTNGCTSYGCSEEDSSTSGYWTSSPVSVDSYRAWYVDSYGRLLRNDVDIAFSFGVRPVITIQKSVLN